MLSKQLLRPMNRSVRSIPRNLVGLDATRWHEIMAINQPRVLYGNHLESLAGLTSGDRRIIDGRPHVEGGNYFDGTVASNVRVIERPISGKVIVSDFPFTLWAVANVNNTSPVSTAIVSLANDASGDPQQRWWALNSYYNTVYAYRYSGSATSNITTGLTFDYDTWTLFGMTYTSATTCYARVNHQKTSSIDLSALSVPVVATKQYLVMNDARQYSTIDGNGKVMLAGIAAANLSDDEWSNLYETLMRNKGGPIELPQISSLKRFFMLNERDGNVALDAANPLSDQTIGVIDNYTASSRAVSISVPKQPANDQGCSRALKASSGNYYDTGFALPSEGEFIFELIQDGSGADQRIGVRDLGGSSNALWVRYTAGTNLETIAGSSAVTVASSIVAGRHDVIRIRFEGTDQTTWVNGVEYAGTGGGLTIPNGTLFLGALNDMNGSIQTSNPLTSTLVRFHCKDLDGNTLYDTKVDGWGTKVGDPELILIPENQVSKQAGTIEDIAENTPDFLGSAPRDIVLEKSSHYYHSGGTAFALDETKVIQSEKRLRISYEGYGNTSSYQYPLTLNSVVLNGASNGTLYCGWSSSSGGYYVAGIGGTALVFNYFKFTAHTSVWGKYEWIFDGDARTVTFLVDDGYTYRETLDFPGTTELDFSSPSSMEMGRYNRYSEWKLHIGNADTLIMHIPFSEGNGPVVHDVVSGDVIKIPDYNAANWLFDQPTKQARNAAEGFSFAPLLVGSTQAIQAIDSAGVFNGVGDPIRIQCSFIPNDDSTDFDIFTSGYNWGGDDRSHWAIERWYTSGGRLVFRWDDGARQAVQLGSNGDCAPYVLTEVDLIVNGTSLTGTVTFGGEVVVINETLSGAITSKTGYGSPFTSIWMGNDSYLTSRPLHGIVRHCKVTNQTTGQYSFWKLDESYEKLAAIDSGNMAMHGVYIGRNYDADDVTRIPALSSEGVLLDAWNLDLSNPGVHRRSDGITNSGHESKENWRSTDYLGNVSNAPFSEEYEGYVELGGSETISTTTAPSWHTSGKSMFLSVDLRPSGAVSDEPFFGWVGTSSDNTVRLETGVLRVRPVGASPYWSITSIAPTYGSGWKPNNWYRVIVERSADGLSLTTSVYDLTSGVTLWERQPPTVLNAFDGSQVLNLNLIGGSGAGAKFNGDMKNVRWLKGTAEVVRCPMNGTLKNYGADSYSYETSIYSGTPTFPRAALPAAKSFYPLYPITGGYLRSNWNFLGDTFDAGGGKIYPIGYSDYNIANISACDVYDDPDSDDSKIWRWTVTAHLGGINLATVSAAEGVGVYQIDYQIRQTSGAQSGSLELYWPTGDGATNTWLPSAKQSLSDGQPLGTWRTISAIGYFGTGQGVIISEFNSTDGTFELRRVNFRKIMSDPHGLPVALPRYLQTSEEGERRHIAYTPKPKYR